MATKWEGIIINYEMPRDYLAEKKGKVLIQMIEAIREIPFREEDYFYGQDFLFDRLKGIAQKFGMSLCPKNGNPGWILNHNGHSAISIASNSTPGQRIYDYYGEPMKPYRF